MVAVSFRLALGALENKMNMQFYFLLTALSAMSSYFAIKGTEIIYGKKSLRKKLN
jgi:hypothetical protein